MSMRVSTHTSMHLVGTELEHACIRRAVAERRGCRSAAVQRAPPARGLHVHICMKCAETCRDVAQPCRYSLESSRREIPNGVQSVPNVLHANAHKLPCTANPHAKGRRDKLAALQSRHAASDRLNCGTSRDSQDSNDGSSRRGDVACEYGLRTQ